MNSQAYLSLGSPRRSISQEHPSVIHSPRGAFTSRGKQHTLLSPVQQKPHPVLKRKLNTLLQRAHLQKPNQSLQSRDLTKGFQLFRKLFALEPEARRVVKPPTPKPVPVPIVTVEQPKPPLKLQIPEAHSPTVSTLLDLENQAPTPRRRSSVLHNHFSVTLQVEEPSPPVLPSHVQQILTPVLKIQEIDASELSSSSSSEDSFPQAITSRRCSQFRFFSRQTSSISNNGKDPYTRRLTMADSQQSLMRDYSMKTAEMLGDTHFRLRDVKTQRLIPQRYFKHL